MKLKHTAAKETMASIQSLICYNSPDHLCLGLIRMKNCYFIHTKDNPEKREDIHLTCEHLETFLMGLLDLYRYETMEGYSKDGLLLDDNLDLPF